MKRFALFRNHHSARAGSAGALARNHIGAATSAGAGALAPDCKAIKKQPSHGFSASLFFILTVAALLLGGCASKPEITQVNTIDSLLAGVYDGAMTLGELRAYGDFGIGTFDRLDGEMMLYKGVFYQIKADGKVYLPGDAVTTPFASTVRFEPQKTVAAADGSFKKICDLIDAACPNPNGLYAIAINGRFRTMHTRSVPAQEKPYRPLAEVTKTQPEFKMEHVDGMVAGFRLPAFVKGINVPGYHLHFVSADKTSGGHILDFHLQAGSVEVAEIHRFRIILPEDGGAFAGADLTKDRSQELHEVESAR